jgi:nucleoside-diphosphate-sugar epimerase
VDLLQPYPLLFSNAKLKGLLGWKPVHSLDAPVVRDTVDKFKAEGNWPNAKPKATR